MAGLMFLPGLLIFTIVDKKLKAVVFNKNTYIGTAIFTFIGLGYYFLREAYNPGYISAVIENELGGRYLVEQPASTHSFFFYLENLLSTSFSYWILLLPCGMLIGILHKDKKISNISLYCSILSIMFFLIISASKTKYNWYDAPLYPFMGLFAAIFIYYIFQLLSNINGLSQHLKVNALPIIFLFLVFVNPYRTIIHYNYMPVELNTWDKQFYKVSKFLKENFNKGNSLDGIYLLHQGYAPHISYYFLKYKEIGQEMNFISPEDLKEGYQFISTDMDLEQKIKPLYLFEKLSDNPEVNLYQISSHKKDSSFINVNVLHELKTSGVE
ncbi:MAG: hypothetical protein H0X62_11040 [Bacteroidetes bacterium]|nr:hypothetical protein [Bacteroidota bacterium]